jgi:hypothetical protein
LWLFKEVEGHLKKDCKYRLLDSAQSFPSQRGSSTSIRGWWGGFLRDETLNLKRRVPCLGPRGTRAKPVSGACEVACQKLVRPTRGKASFRSLGTRKNGYGVGIQPAARMEGRRSRRPVSGRVAVAPAGRGIGPALLTFRGSAGGQINLGADAQPRRRYDFISRRTTVYQTAPAGSGSILSHAAREAHELTSPQGLRPPAAGVGGGVVRASPACPVPACPLGTG